MLLQQYLVNFIETVDARHVNSVAFNHVNEIIGSGILFQDDVSVTNLVLAKDLRKIKLSKNRSFNKYRYKSTETYLETI